MLLGDNLDRDAIGHPRARGEESCVSIGGYVACTKLDTNAMKLWSTVHTVELRTNKFVRSCLSVNFAQTMKHKTKAQRGPKKLQYRYIPQRFPSLLDTCPIALFCRCIREFVASVFSWISSNSSVIGGSGWRNVCDGDDHNLLLIIPTYTNLSQPTPTNT